MKKILYFLLILGLGFSMISCEKEVEPYMYTEWTNMEFHIDARDTLYTEIIRVYTNASKDDFCYISEDEWINVSLYGDPESWEEGYLYKLLVNVNTVNYDSERARETYLELKYKNLSERITFIQDKYEYTKEQTMLLEAESITESIDNVSLDIDVYKSNDNKYDGVFTYKDIADDMTYTIPIKVTPLVSDYSTSPARVSLKGDKDRNQYNLALSGYIFLERGQYNYNKVEKGSYDISLYGQRKADGKYISIDFEKYPTYH